MYRLEIKKIYVCTVCIQYTYNTGFYKSIYFDQNDISFSRCIQQREKEEEEEKNRKKGKEASHTTYITCM